MIKPEFQNWWQLHKFLLSQKDKLQKNGAVCAKIRDVLFNSSTVKIRIGYSHYFASEVLRLRMNSKAGDELRRDFEAWLFFTRSTLDCLAQFINDICNLGLADHVVGILKIIAELEQRKNLQVLSTFLKTEIDNNVGSWFWHLNQLRNLVTHRSVVRVMQYGYIDMPAPKRDDLRFTLEDPNDLSSFSEKPEFGLGQYAEDQFNMVYKVIEEVCEIIFSEIKTGNIKIVP